MVYTGLSRLLAEHEDEVKRVKEELVLAHGTSSDLNSQLREAQQKIEQLVRRSCDNHVLVM